MGELTIQAHDFENYKKELKRFSEKIPSSIDLPTVATEAGLFGWFNHTVTGAELNELTNQVLAHLIATNSYLIDSIKEFGQVYNTFEALDKEYIQGILVAVKAAEKASNQAKESASKAEINSQDIAKTIEVQSKTIAVLNKFKEQLDKYIHLENVDEMWSDYQMLKNDISPINSKLNILDKQIKQLSGRLKISYILAGSSLFVALVSIGMIILGVV